MLRQATLLRQRCVVGFHGAALRDLKSGVNGSQIREGCIALASVRSVQRVVFITY